MRKTAIYADPHITKKMNNFQGEWEHSVISVFTHMYEKFKADKVTEVVCLGDLFDKPVLEARSVNLVNKVLSIINNCDFYTHILLGNHEIFDDESNVLDYLSPFERISPVTKVLDSGQYLFVPYNVPLESIPEEQMAGKYLFTHHDIYGSRLAGTTAKFGVDPGVLNKAKRVLNGHVHLRSEFKNVKNVGSILKSQQGELDVLDFPSYYYLSEGSLSQYDIKTDFIAPLTVRQEQIPEVLDYYDESVKFILRVSYADDLSLEEIEKYRNHPRILKLSLKNEIDRGALYSSDTVSRKSQLDLKEFITQHINNDPSVQEQDKQRLIDLSIKSLEV